MLEMWKGKKNHTLIDTKFKLKPMTHAGLQSMDWPGVTTTCGHMLLTELCVQHTVFSLNEF